MTTSSVTWTQEMVEVAGTRINLVKGGTGDPLLVLHDEMGHPGWLHWHEALAQNHTLYIPWHPGFGESEPLDWVMNLHDLAVWYLGALDDLGLEGVDVMGFSLGGWLAAEMAVMNPQQFKRLALVGAAGVRPPEGEIFDIFQVVAKVFITRSLLNPESVPEFQAICPDEPSEEQAFNWETSLEGACRLSWRPYMHYPALPNLLPRLKRLPTLVISGDQDPIVPPGAANLYHTSIPNSRLEIIENCGHRPEVEQTEKFVEVMRKWFQV